MVSKIHILGHPGACKYNIYVSDLPFNPETYIQITEKATAWHKAQSERVIDVGNMPTRYLIFEVVNGSPLATNP
jgi:hypothetical protein